MSVAPNTEQLAAIAESGVVFVSAGAGTGKTTVLVERFARAVLERGVPVDGLLVITYTERAAGELKARIRARLVAEGRRDLAREVDRAWISTVHGFCSRLLRSRPFEAGLDPRFRVLDESQSRVLRSEAFAAALAAFCADRRPDRVELLATYGSRDLRTMLIGVFERLRSAGRPLELASDAPSTLVDRLRDVRDVGREAIHASHDPDARAVVERLLALLDPPPPPEQLLDLSELDPPRSLARNGLGVFVEAVRALELAARADVAARHRVLLQELLVAFAEAYQRAKDQESAVDFEDLQLRVRDLLRASDSVREELRWRFRQVMVDEFQDTNRLQCELIDLIGAQELFFVGDEFQSIYRFRHADVSVFRQRRAQSGGVLALTKNYRSRPEVLDVVNHVFSSEFGPGFEPLDAAGRFSDPLFEPAVELLVSDKASYRGNGSWREGEARHVARRLRELVDQGACAPGEIVVLFAAGTSAETYEAALREQGLPTHRATGRGYYGQQQVVDLLMYLRLLRNRYDDEALLAVLASPFVGVSNDALVLLRRAASRRPLFSGLEREPPEGLSPRDRRLFEAFRQRYERLVRASSVVGLEQLCELIVAEHDYDLAVLARWDGRRRYANMRKLARLARSFEELRGPDIEGFVRFVRDLDDAGAREGEAVAEEEGADAVRLLTIHAAKGLEFKVVVVADCGRAGGRAAPEEILCLPDGRFGFKLADPATGRRIDAPGFREVREAEREAAAEEARRLYYVAMTRAIDRLILSGALDPERADAAQTPIGWMLGTLGATLVEADGPTQLDAGGASVTLRVDRWAAAEPAAPQATAPAAAPGAAEEQLELFAVPEPGEPALAPELPGLVPPPAPAPPRLRRLSFSALALYQRCSYRFWAERIAGLPARPAPSPAAGEHDGLVATELGDAVHVLLETGARGEEALAWLAKRYPAATADDRDRVAEMLAAWDGSAIGARLAALEGGRPELTFTFEAGPVLLHGRFDLYRRDGDRALVVDYKTNRLDGESPAEVVARDYELQRLVYALAALRDGAAEVETVYVFLERPDELVERTFRQADVPLLEATLAETVETIEQGVFRPTPSERACAECPVLDLVCAGPRLLEHDPWDAPPVGAELGR
ncbi:MAG: UvrD-helicase domain-containing protein [Thermoleophilia bacterium]